MKGILTIEKKKKLHQGLVIPAHPLALTADRKINVQSQRRLTRYYLEAGAGGIAVGVHTTQFAIRDAAHNLLEEVLTLASEEVAKHPRGSEVIRLAGVSGPTSQAVAEADLARALGYDLALISPNGLQEWTEAQLLERAQKVSAVLPLFGFYLQPAVGGKVLGPKFWKAFAEIPNVCAIKIAPFNRYQTLDVVRAVAASSRNEEISLYTGNDDNIVNDLLTTYEIMTPNGMIRKNIVGGLLGQWACWTSKAVELLEEIHAVKENASGHGSIPQLLSLGQKITDANAAIFDAANQFHGCIPGIHYVLQRQGLLDGIWCLDPGETLSAGQADEIERVYDDYPELSDDQFVSHFLQKDLQAHGH